LRQKRRWSEYMMLARFLICLNKCDEALSFLEPLRQMEEQLGLHGRLIGVLILKALALQALDQNDEAADALQQALSLAQPEGYLRIFVDEGPALIPLLRRLARGGFVPEYTARLLNAFSNGEAEAPSAAPLPNASTMIDPLSQREMEVLRLLDTDLSVPEIADMLFVATSTVRSHIKQIYSKLGVHRRREAVLKAETLGLLAQ
jgi:LuxR family maltose regulon positive regulatory protein